MELQAGRDLLEQLVHAPEAERVQHPSLLFFSVGNVAHR
jgi:hypothetical protein